MPKELRESLSMIYDEVRQELEKMPSLTVRVDADQIEQVNAFKEKYRQYVLNVLRSLLIEKTKVCVLEYNERSAAIRH